MLPNLTKYNCKETTADAKLLPGLNEDFFYYFKNDLQIRDKSDSTIKSYIADLQGFSRWLKETKNGRFNPDRMTSPNLLEYKQYLLKIKRLAPRSVNRKLAAFRQFLVWANKNELLSNGLPDLPREVRTTQVNIAPKSLIQEQQDDLCRAVEKEKNLRDIAIIKLLLNTGLRVSEVCKLCRCDIDFKPRGGTIVVQGKGQKFRIIPLNAEVRETLSRYFKEYPRGLYDRVFFSTRGILKGSMTTVSVQKMFRKYRNLAGICDTGITVHSLRHTFATRMLEKGRSLVEVQALLGHENINTTAIYTRPNHQSLKAAVDSLCKDQYPEISGI
ncbi:site-specific recombinase XerD [Desulfocucumis palustris]|uniref:Site-specific recombinase XerD n=1 Tax=Desulfocucumis palustris TaxID=1898651 RepID=A0A2L2X780_9FIRM|nr:tyrosine-type recombinase/integrase [Desulfocucumis palustris]GBF31928.1 site-specific recombinase XerD [Desulfocucumis palustris]